MNSNKDTSPTLKQPASSSSTTTQVTKTLAAPKTCAPYAKRYAEAPFVALGRMMGNTWNSCMETDGGEMDHLIHDVTCCLPAGGVVLMEALIGTPLACVASMFAGAIGGVRDLKNTCNSSRNVRKNT